MRERITKRAKATRSGQLLREYRVAAELTEDELAQRIGTSRTVVSFAELGYRLLTSDELATRLARECGQEPNDLLAALYKDRKTLLEQKLQAVERQIKEIEEPVAA